MSAIDETWTPSTARFETTINGNDVEVFLGENGRLRIAACAPEALRLLLTQETVFVKYDYGMVLTCRWCTANALEGMKHTDACAWFSLMKKAGLR